MTVNTGRQRALEIRHGAHLDVTFTTRHRVVFANERELQSIVIERREAIDPVVTGQTSLTKVGHVIRYKIGLILAVARFASGRIKGRDVVAVAIGARKRLTRLRRLMHGQRKGQTRMREVGHIQADQ